MITRAPQALCKRHVDALRPHGLSDRDILDAVQVVSYFNYINRVADALGVDPEPEMQAAHEKWQRTNGVSLTCGKTLRLHAPSAPRESPISRATLWMWCRPSSYSSAVFKCSSINGASIGSPARPRK